MIPKLRKWSRERQFVMACRVLGKAAERHKAAGHDVRFEAVNEAHVRLECEGCPDYLRTPTD
jgi:hypothetical protein